MSKDIRRNIFGASLLALGVAATSSAHAQTPPPADDDEAIVVTGSRIARPGFASNSPIATVGSEEIALQQPADIEELLRDQPQFAAGNGSNVNNGSSGASTLDLRGLSEPRTLPLIDGKRMVGYGPNGLFDLAAVPISLLERVDVVTGGASAVYGSDAIAGVVNFILNDDFQGLEARYNHSFNDLHDTGDTDEASVTMGASFDDGRGNVALAVNWLTREPVYQIKGVASRTPGNSFTTDPAAFDLVANGDVFQLNDAGNLVPFYRGFDFNGQNLYQAPQQRWGETALASYDINEAVEAYGRFIFQSSDSAPQLAASGTFGRNFEVPLNNPFLTAQAVDILDNEVVTPCSVDPMMDCVNVDIYWRAQAVGPRQYSYEYDTFQTLLGLRGELAGGWRWDVAYAYGESSLKREQRNDVDSNRIQQALFAADANTCIDPSNGCAPLNFFDPGTPPTDAALNFISLDLQAQSLTTQEYATGSLTGELPITSPFASTATQLSVGAEYRKEHSDYNPDAPSQAGTSAGFGSTYPVHGGYDVLEFFGEALVPLVEDAPWAHSVNLELGYRISDYSTSGSVESYKYGLDWAPVESLRLRGMFQRAVRAASIAELYAPVAPGTGDLLVDPCSGVTAAGNLNLYNLCIATGVPNPTTLAQPSSGQVNNFAGGDPNIEPETADTITAGFVFRPRGAFEGFSATVDYFDITVNDAISIRPAFDVMDGCYSAARNPTFSALDADCQLIVRNAVTGSLQGDPIYGVNQGTQNIGDVHVEGIDYSFGYVWDLSDLGQISIGLDGTHLLTTSYTPTPESGEVDCLGYYGKTCGLPSTVNASVGGPVSEDRWVQRTTWSIGNWDVSYRWRHLSAVEIDQLTRAGGAITGELDPDSVSIPDYDYVDLSLAWQATPVVRFAANVTNVTDQDAPFVATSTGSTSFNSGNTYPSSYDALGRVITLGVTARF